jgi:hypothetical protein
MKVDPAARNAPSSILGGSDGYAPRGWRVRLRLGLGKWCRYGATSPPALGRGEVPRVKSRATQNMATTWGLGPWDDKRDNEPRTKSRAT